MPKAELISQAEYARRRGVDPTSVRDAVRAGRITLIDGKIDPAVADVQWERNTRRRARAVDEAPRQLAPATRGEGAYASPPDDDVPDYNLERARRERYEADQAELRLAQMRGELVRADDVKAAHQRKVAALLEAFLQLPARVVPMLAADATPAGMDAVLTREIHLAMAMLQEID